MYKQFSIRRIFTLVLVQLSLVACATQTQTQSLPLKFIAAIEIDREATQDGIQIGGLSSAHYNPETRELSAVSDDTGYVSGPRIQYFDLELTDSSLAVTSKRMVRLTNANGERIYPERIVDGEAMVELPSGAILVASEGVDVKGFFDLPGLFEFNSSGNYLNEWPIPNKFMPKGKKMAGFGVRPNDAFESLSLSPDGSTLFMANEKAMFQDGSIPALDTKTPIRVVEYNATINASTPVAEYIYMVSPLARLNNDNNTTGFRSVSGFLAVDNKTILVMEKTFFTKPVMKNSVQLYMAKISSGTTNVATYPGVSERTYTAMSKSLWIDLDQFEGTNGFPNLDNVEGITFGPDLPNGNRTLILLTDNNFSKRQKTLIYAFEILSM